MSEESKVNRGRPKKVESVTEVPVEKQDTFDIGHDLPVEDVKEEVFEEVSEDIIPEEPYEEIVEKETVLPSSACSDCSYRYKSSQCKSCVENVKNK